MIGPIEDGKIARELVPFGLDTRTELGSSHGGGKTMNAAMEHSCPGPDRRGRPAIEHAKTPKLHKRASDRES